MSNQHKSTYQSSRIPFIIKSKYFGQYQPQVYIASRSKSKQQSKKLPLTKTKQQNLIFQQKSQRIKQFQLYQEFKSKAQKSNQKKAPISLQKFLKNRKKNNDYDESACAKIFNWIQKRIIKMNLIQQNSRESIYSSNENNNSVFAQKIRRITYNLYIIKKAGKLTHDIDIFQQLGMQSIKVHKNSKENVIQQIENQKRNLRQNIPIFADLNKNEQGVLKVISESQNQDYSSRINKNKLSSESNYKISGLSYQEYVKNFQFNKAKNQQTSNTLNNFHDQAIELKESCEVSIDQYIPKQNQKMFSLKQNQSNSFNQIKQQTLNQSSQKIPNQFVQYISQISKIQQSKKVTISHLKKYMRVTALCDSDNFFASIFAYEVRPEPLIPLESLQIADQILQQQHENYDPFQNSHSQMLNIITAQNLSNSQIMKKNFSPAAKYIQNNLIGNNIEQNHQQVFTSKINESNLNLQKDNIKMRKSNNTTVSNSLSNKGPQNILSYYFSERNIQNQNSPKIQSNTKINQQFTFQNILETRNDDGNQRIYGIKQGHLISPFQKPHLVQDIRVNKFLRQNRQIEKSQCSSKKSSKPKVIFHYLSPIQNQNKIKEFQQKPPIRISLNSNKEDKNNIKFKIAQNNLKLSSPLHFNQTKKDHINILQRPNQNLIPLPIARYRSQSGFVVYKETCQQQNQIYQNNIIDRNKDYFPPNKLNFNYNYVTVPTKTKNYEFNPKQVQQANVAQSQCFTKITQICGIQNRFAQVPKKRTRSLNEKLLVTCANQLLM